MLFEDDSGDEEMPDDFGMESDESEEDLDDDPKGSDEEDDEEKLENNLEEIEKVRIFATNQMFIKFGQNFLKWLKSLF